MKIFIRCFIAVLLLLASVLLPPLLTAEDKLGQEIERRRAASFSGVIEVWQADTFRGGTGSRANWLAAMLTKLERRYNGVYFNVRTVTKEKALAALQGGDAPDILSIGIDALTDTQGLQALGRYEVLEGLRDACAGYAVPLCFGAYCLLADSAYGDITFEALPQVLGGINGTVMYNKRRVAVDAVAIPTELNAVNALRGMDISGIKTATGTAEAVWEMYNWRKTSATLLATQRELYRHNSASAKNRGRASCVLPLPGYTDMVQVLCVPDNKPEKRLAVINSAIAYLLSTDVQLELNKIGLFPANGAALRQIRYDVPFMEQLRISLMQTEIYCPAIGTAQNK